MKDIRCKTPNYKPLKENSQKLYNSEFGNDLLRKYKFSQEVECELLLEFDIIEKIL